VGDEEQQGALSEGDVETRKMDAGGAHAPPGTDAQVASTDAAPRKYDAHGQLHIYS
jgi:hypothetical protein